MELKTESREATRKSDVRALRRGGRIPAVVYGLGKGGETISLCENTFKTFLDKLPMGHLPTTKFTLVGEDGSKREAIIKEIQYHPTTYRVVHIDFLLLEAKTPVTVRVPIECRNAADCIGVKLGGVLRQVQRFLKVRCLPADIPTALSVDVQDLAMKQSKRLRDLHIPEKVTPVADLSQVAVLIAKR